MNFKYCISLYFLFFTLFQNKLLAESEENIRILQEIKQKQFYDSGLIHSLLLNFKEDSTYIFEYGSEGIYWYNEGLYSFEKDRIVLKPSICKERKADKNRIPCKETFAFGNCKIKETPHDLEFEKYLVCKSHSNPAAFGLGEKREGFPFGISEYSTKPEKEMKYKNHKISLIKKYGITLTNVKIREEPNVKSASVEFYSNFEENTFSEFVPRNTELYVIGKTISKSTVQNYINYWYLVDVGYQKKVWMFAEFIKLEE